MDIEDIAAAIVAMEQEPKERPPWQPSWWLIVLLGVVNVVLVVFYLVNR